MDTLSTTSQTRSEIEQLGAQNRGESGELGPNGAQRESGGGGGGVQGAPLAARPRDLR